MKFAAILLTIASMQSHGWSGDQTPYPELEAQLHRDERIVVSCGTVANLGVRAVRAAGGRARLVGAVTRRPYNGYDDGHIMLELRTRRGWTLFDLDLNRRAPWGIGIAEQVAAVRRDRARWITIASDPLYDVAEAAECACGTEQVAADPRPWTRDIFGLPRYYVEARGWYFRDRVERSDAESLGHLWAPRKLWERLIGEEVGR